MASIDSAVDEVMNDVVCKVGEYSQDYLLLLRVKGAKAILDWCMKEGLIASRYACPKCGDWMRLIARPKSKTSDMFAWRCRKQGSMNAHDVTRSVRNGSWFSESHLSMYQILKITRNWFGSVPQNFVMKEVGVHEHALVDWYSFCREVCVLAVVEDSEKIGGEDVIVEIDESKFGKMKYGRGRPVEGQWVFGGIERGTNKCFFRAVEKRSKECLLAIIKEWVLPGSTIISDCWKAYDCLQDEGFVHLRVNHSLTYKDPETGAHTNSIEAIWSAIKRTVRKNPNHAKGQFDSYLMEYVWRKFHDHSLEDEIYKDFLAAIRRVYPPPEHD